jgi:hypothetical protein
MVRTAIYYGYVIATPDVMATLSLYTILCHANCTTDELPLASPQCARVTQRKLRSQECKRIGRADVLESRANFNRPSGHIQNQAIA